MEQNLKLSLIAVKKFNDPIKYSQLIERLIYLNVTKPNTVYSVGMFSQFVYEPRNPHLETVLWVMRYIKGTLGQGLLLLSKTTGDYKYIAILTGVVVELQNLFGVS